MANGDRMGKTHKKEEAVSALLVCPTIKEAASACGLHENTLLRWLQDPEFKTQYAAARREMRTVSMNRLQAIAGEAVETMRQIMTDENSPSSARVSAARAVLEMTLKTVEFEEIVARIEKLELAVGSRGNCLPNVS